jgi:type VI secretion system protein ImpA
MLPQRHAGLSARQALVLSDRAAMLDGALSPVSRDSPCGPDLEEIGDRDFLNFLVTMEGLLPTGWIPVDAPSIDFSSALTIGDALLARTQDVRLIVLLAKLAIRNRDLDSFAARLATLAWLLANHWNEAHPRGNNDDFAERMGQLQTLDEREAVQRPLRNTPLVSSQRGSVSFDAYAAAVGAPALRPTVEGYANVELSRGWTTAAIDQIVADADLAALVHTYESVLSIKASVSQMEALSLRKCGFVQAPNFRNLSPLLDGVRVFISGAIEKKHIDAHFRAWKPRQQDV